MIVLSTEWDRMTESVYILLLYISATKGELFIKICESSSGHHCCAAGMAGSEYWVMQHTGSWASLDIECRLESEPYSHLVILDSRAESNCIIKYLMDEYGGAQKRYAIGLKSPDEYRGVYEWRGTDAPPEFTNWAAGYPKDNPYVYMTVGVSGSAQNGRWADTTANDLNLFGICERNKESKV